MTIHQHIIDLPRNAWRPVQPRPKRLAVALSLVTVIVTALVWGVLR